MDHTIHKHRHTLTIKNIVLRVAGLCLIWPLLLHAAAGDLDISFDLAPGPNTWVGSIIVQPDSRILIAGGFWAGGGFPHNHIARLNSDGTLDSSFDPGSGAGGSGSGVHREIYAIVLQPDGKIVVGGGFTHFNGVARDRIVRLNADGSVDQVFDPGAGFDSDVMSLALLANGQILVGGWFKNVNGVGRVGIARLNANGSLDASFDAGAGPTGFAGAGTRYVRAINVLTSGKILVGGWFHEFAGQTVRNLVRLESNGGLDVTFNAQMDLVASGESVSSIVVQPDNKILISGSFNSFAGTVRANIARLEIDGALDTLFDVGTYPNDRVGSLALQPNGQVLATGNFRLISMGTQYLGVIRLNTDGSLDASFDTVTDGVNAITLQTDKKILIAGDFREIHGVTRTRVARLLGDATTASSTTSTSSTTTTTTSTTASTTFPATFPHARARLTLALSLFNGAVDIGNGWKWVPWFGMYYDANAPWYYHNEHGWVYTTSTNDNDIWFYQAQLGWFWTTRTTYPLVWRTSDSTWLGYMLGSKNPRWFWNYNTTTWEAIN